MPLLAPVTKHAATVHWISWRSAASVNHAFALAADPPTWPGVPGTSRWKRSTTRPTGRGPVRRCPLIRTCRGPGPPGLIAEVARLLGDGPGGRCSSSARTSGSAGPRRAARVVRRGTAATGYHQRPSARGDTGLPAAWRAGTARLAGQGGIAPAEADLVIVVGTPRLTSGSSTGSFGSGGLPRRSSSTSPTRPAEWPATARWRPGWPGDLTAFFTALAGQASAWRPAAGPGVAAQAPGRGACLRRRSTARCWRVGVRPHPPRPHLRRAAQASTGRRRGRYRGWRRLRVLRRASPTWNRRKPGGWLDPGPFGCLGTGLGYAAEMRGAALSSQVVLLLGDGAAGLSLMDVDTLVRHKLPVVMVVRQQRRVGPGKVADAARCSATTWPPSWPRERATTR